MAKMIFVCARGVLVVTESDGSYSVPATSGSGECLNNPSASCRRRNVGPIPSGLYYVFRSQINDPIAIRDYIRNRWFGDWGDWRIPLRNAARSAPLGREGFFLHGGSRSGSAGCIDIGGFWHGTPDTDRVLSSIMKVEVSELWVE